MIRKNFHKYLESQQNPDNLVYIYGLQKKNIIQKNQTKETNDLLIQEAATAIVKEVQQLLKI